MGHKLNYFAFIIFLIITGLLGVLGLVGIFISLEPENYGETEIGSWVTIWVITAVFGILSYVFYKKIHEHEQKLKSPQQKTRERKQLLYTLAGAAVVGVLVAAFGGSLSGEFCFSSNTIPTIKGTDGDDHIIGTSGNDVIIGKKGDDFIDGRGGNDIICGHEGDDHIIGGSGNDELWGGDGNDILEGNDGDDRLWGHQGINHLDGGHGQDSCFNVKGTEENCEIG